MSGIRFSGIASGMDTETMVKQLMDAEKIRLNKYNQSKEIKKWTQEAYNDINKEMANFILESKKELGVGSSGSVSGASWIKEATSSNTNIFDASATSSAVSGTHSINVTQLAEGVTLGSASAIQNSGEDKTLDQLGVGAVGVFSMNINGEAISLDSSNTLLDVVSAINSKTDVTGVKASYDSSIGRLFLNTTSTGSSSEIKITGDTYNLFVDPDGAGAGESILKTNMSANGGDTTSSDPAVYVGKDAIIDFDGANDIKYSSNNITINGININLKSTGNSTVKVDTDVDGVYDKIKGFVDKYNELLDKLNNKIGEESYRDYQPLTDEQKKAMDDDTVKMWEEKAKSGLLKGDEHISRMIDTTRAGLYEEVYSDYSDDGIDNDTKLSGFSFIGDIGITTGNYKDKGKLKIDETKLKDAITKDVDGVMKLLFDTPSSDTIDETEKRKETGLINRLYDDMIDGMKNIIDKSGTGGNASLYRSVKSNILIDFVTKSGSISLLDKDVVNIEKQIDRENSRLSSVEDRYWRQFTAMEKAMNEMNSQSSWIASQMGGM